ncbi:MAG: four helix bundle protein [Patescibacteria group bacterium]|nr:four helix bundle protein [Patescibacteria group bacterium]
MYVQPFEKLRVWRDALDLVGIVYRDTEALPAGERFGLQSQMRRASVSIVSNIAEGYKRRRTSEYLDFLGYADASAAELYTQSIICKKIFPRAVSGEAREKLAKIQKALTVLRKKLGGKAGRA